MSFEITFPMRQAGNGALVTTIAGKAFEVVSAYKDSAFGGHFFLALSGTQVLDWDNIGEHWKVMGRKGKFFAFSQRAFSYHLAIDDGEVPLGCTWPKLKTPYDCFAVVGVTEEAVIALATLLRDEYAPSRTLQEIKLREVQDDTGKGPAAWIVEL